MDEQRSASAGYSLVLSEQEQSRYRMMAAGAAAGEAAEWTAAGITDTAHVADVGCGPGAVLRLLAERVGRDGVAIGIDADPRAVSMAAMEVADLPQAQVRVGSAEDTGLQPDSFNVVMCRHVLAHNGGKEATIVAHLRSLTVVGGSVYLVDIDATAFRLTTADPEIHELQDRYRAFQRDRGNDLSVGLRLGDLLTDADLRVERYVCRSPVLSLQPGMRPPSWAARSEMVAEGFATESDLERWDAAFTRLDAAEERPWLFPAAFVAVGRRQH